MILQDRTLAFILHCFLFLFRLDIQIETKSKICLIGTSFYHNIGMEGVVMGSRPTVCVCVCVCLCNLPIKKKRIFRQEMVFCLDYCYTSYTD